MTTQDIIILAAFTGIIVSALFVSTSGSALNFGGVPQAPSYNTASSSAFTVGHQLSTPILNQKGGRGYAIFCNVSPNRLYLSLSSTAITATSSGDVLIPGGECYEINRDNLYTGDVHAIQETASTTNTLLVTELLGS